MCLPHLELAALSLQPSAQRPGPSDRERKHVGQGKCFPCKLRCLGMLHAVCTGSLSCARLCSIAALGQRIQTHGGASVAGGMAHVACVQEITDILCTDTDSI